MNIDEKLAKKLINEQFPEWSHLTVTPVETSGWDNRTFHLGDGMSIRMPSDEAYAPQILKEFKWLPVLAKGLSVQITNPIALGKPSDTYPWHWSVNQWLDGDVASLANIANLNDFAESLGCFLNEFHKIDATTGPQAGEHNFHRGGDLANYDKEMQEALPKINEKQHREIATALWQDALSSKWQEKLVWVHGDLATGNILVRDGKLHAIIDFGCMAVGDPACDLVLAWNFFDKESREIFQRTVSIDKATWIRAMAWALWKTLCWPIKGTPVSKILDLLYVDYQAIR